MNLVLNLYVALLFVLLTPGVLLTLPKGGKKLTVALVHGLVFAAVYYFTYKIVWRFSVTLDGFQGAVASAAKNAAKPLAKPMPKPAPKPVAKPMPKAMPKMPPAPPKKR